MTLGFIGTGAITEAMVDGLCGHGGYDGNVIVSARTRARSERLRDKYSNVSIDDDNQAIVDASDVVVIAVLPQQAEEVLGALSFRPDHHVLSVIAALKLQDLRRLISPATRVQRAVPLPPVERGLGPIPLCPPDTDMNDLLARAGTVVAVDDERQFQALAAGSALMATLFAFMARTARWLEDEDVAAREAALYSTSMVHALAAVASDADPSTLRDLPEECLTPGGINEQVLRQIEAAGWLDEIDRGLSAIMTRLEGA